MMLGTADRASSKLNLHRRLVLLVCSFEVFDALSVEVPDPRSYFIDQVVIVRYQQHRALISLQSDVQCIDGFEVQMVRGLESINALNIALQRYQGTVLL